MAGRIGQGLAVARCLAMAVGVLAAGTGAAAARDQIVIGITQFPTTLHPAIDSMAVKSYLLGMVHRPITTYDADWKLVCRLCLDLPSFAAGTAVEERRADGSIGLAVRYRLDPAARWGDGTPLTTEDVRFTWQVGRHPQSGFSNARLFAEEITDITLHDAHAFTLHLRRKVCDYQGINDFLLLPAHLERPVFEADPTQYRHRTLYLTRPTEPGLYLGPYRIAELTMGSHVVLSRNDAWWGKAPAFDRIVVRVIENSAALEANLLAGGLDYVPGEVGLPLDQVLALERRHGSRFDVVYQTGLFYEHVDLKLDHPALADLRVRRALLHAIDRDTISRQLFAGRQPVAHNTVHPLDRTYDPTVPTYPYDPAAAARLLDEAGWRRGPGGFRVNPAGERLTFEFMTTAGNLSRELVQQVLQAQWRQAGIDVRIVNQPARVFFGQSLRERTFTGLALFAWLSAPESIPRTMLHSGMIPSGANGYAGQNFTGFRHAEVDRVLDDLEVVCTQPENQTLWNRLQHLYAEQLPALPLYYRADGYLLPKWLKGVRPTGHQYPSSAWIEEWRVAE